jgi:hypothetical protein
MSRWSRCSWVLAAGLLIVSSRSAQAGQEAAKRYFQNGVDLITAAQPNYQDAYYQFQLAYRESAQSWKVLGNLGLCALKLERDQEAASYYEQYLAKGGADIAPEERSAIEQDLLLLKGNLATIRISSPVQDLKVVDRRAGSQAPAQSYSLVAGQLELKLRAGNHTLTAVNGSKRLEWDVVLEPQATAAHEFDFNAAPAAPPTSTSAAPVPATSDRGARGADLRVPGYVALGLGAVGLGLGGYFAWQSADYTSQADEVFACDSRLGGCLPAERSEVRRLEEQSSSAKVRAIVGFAVGGAAVATGIILLAVSGPSANESARAVTPWVGYREVGLSGRF